MFGHKKKSIRFVAALSFAVFGAGAAHDAFAQSASSAEAALYKGADRQQHLVEAAKKEGEVTVYTSIQQGDFALVTAAFEKKYGIKVKSWRSSSENILQRAVSEFHANRFDADVIETNSTEMESLHREKMEQEVVSPYLADLIPQAIQKHREWVGSRLDVLTLAYNTNLLKKEDLPKTYEDLLDPKWKGKLGMEADDSTWFATLIGEMGQEKGVKLFRDIVASNGISLRKGHSLLASLVASGEVPLALDIYNYKAAQMKQQGAPIQWFSINPTIAAPMGMAVMKRAPHPNAAMLFFDFMLSDAQAILQKHNYILTNKNMETDLNKMPLKFIDAGQVLDDSAKWSKLYEEIFVKQKK